MVKNRLIFSHRLFNLPETSQVQDVFGIAYPGAIQIRDASKGAQTAGKRQFACELLRRLGILVRSPQQTIQEDKRLKKCEKRQERLRGRHDATRKANCQRPKP